MKVATTPQAKLQTKLVSAIAYGTTAVAANFINKSAMLLLPFAPNSVLMLQLISMYITTSFCNTTGLVLFPSFSKHRFRQLLPLSLAYVAHASMVLRSLLFLNVAVYNTLKRMTPVLVLLFKALHERKFPARQEVACVMLIVSGCVIAGAGDLSFSPFGYAAALLCAVLQAVYILLAEANDSKLTPSKLRGLPPQRASSESTVAKPQESQTQSDSHGPNPAVSDDNLQGGLSTVSSSAEVLYYTSILSIPIVLAATLFSGEHIQWLHAAAELQKQMSGLERLLPWLLALAMAETALAGTLVWCTECNSGLTTSIVGVLKGVVAVVLGFFFMAGSARVTSLNVLGVAMVLLGGSWYSSLQCFRKGKV